MELLLALLRWWVALVWGVGWVWVRGARLAS